MACIVFLFCAVTAISGSAQTFTTLANFDGTDGSTPWAPPVQGADGNLYGTTVRGGTNNSGTVFKMNPLGTLTTLYSFCSEPECSDGSLPYAALILAADGNFYGTTSGTGGNGYGTVFKIAPQGRLTTLYTFCSEASCTDGKYPLDALILAADGNFYGTTEEGGTDDTGEVFKVTPQGALTVLYGFCTGINCSSDGSNPNAGLLQASDGNFYGTTVYGGSGDEGGTVFKITPQGTLTTLYSFCSETDCADGESPYGGLVQGTDGNFYGTTGFGGTNHDGTVFKMTPSGVLTTLYNFCSETNCADGQFPYGGLVQATDGNFYGTTVTGGAIGSGTVFEISPAGALNTLHSFGRNDGANPDTGLLQATNGSFYGTTTAAGAYGNGTTFSLSVGLRPFIQTVPTFGKVGQNITILGDALKGSTSVSFNGTPATTFTASNTAIRVRVPIGATTGSVEVVTASGTVLKSNAPFQIIP
jgi:uncharacterized repeat protein (TIGR03803 family)